MVRSKIDTCLNSIGLSDDRLSLGTYVLRRMIGESSGKYNRRTSRNAFGSTHSSETTGKLSSLPDLSKY